MPINKKELTTEELINMEDTVDLVIQYDETLREFVESRNSYMRIGKIVRGDQAIVYVRGDEFEHVARELGAHNIDYLPILLSTLGTISIEEANILQVQKNPKLKLEGDGVLIGFVDTGIDYTKEAFKYEDGTSKIQYIWDQTAVENTVEGYWFGAEYSNEQINEALKSENPINVVPETDKVGHGTFLASVAAGREKGEYVGAAPNSEIIAVKLRKAREYYLNHYLIPEGQESVFEASDFILGINYLIDKATSLKRPLVICIGIGSNMAGHDGFTRIEEFLSKISNIAGICICTAAGNESHTAHHTQGRVESEGDNKAVDIRVSEYGESFPVYIWNNSSDRMSLSVKSPTGEVVGRVAAKSGTIYEADLILERSRVSIQYNFPLLGSGSQLSTVRIIDPTPGIWTIIIHGDIILDGTYNVWLPLVGLVSPGIEFLEPVPECTIVVPSTAFGTITCGAYNERTNALYINSSWGPTRLPALAPDLVAPGVDVLGTYPHNDGTMTGTSVAASITAGACALMLQWGIVQGNDITLNTYHIRAYLIRGCTRDPHIEYPSKQWGYGKLNLFNVFNQLMEL